MLCNIIESAKTIKLETRVMSLGHISEIPNNYETRVMSLGHISEMPRAYGKTFEYV